MKIIIEALGIHYVGGGRSATLNLLRALFTLDQDNRYLVLLSHPEPALVAPAGNVQQRIAPTRNRFALRLWAQAALPPLARSYDLVHFAKNMGVLGVPARSVVTMYDLTTLIYPELFPAADVLYWRTLQKRTLRTAQRVIAISENTARDVRRVYGVPLERIAVIYPSCALHFRPIAWQEAERIRKLYHLPENFVLHVGRIDRKKNLALLAAAFGLFKRETGFAGKLVFAGEEYPKLRDPTLHETIAHLSLQQDVIFTGRVPDEDLPGLYSAAVCAVFPSLHEGFGITALEAMACGTPLIASQAGAVAETVNDAAYLLPSNTADCLAEALATLVGDAELRQTLRTRGLHRASQFDPSSTAQRTLQVYREALEA